MMPLRGRSRNVAAPAAIDRHGNRQRQPRAPRSATGTPGFHSPDTVEGTRCASRCSRTCTATCRPSRPFWPTSTPPSVEEIWCLGDLVGYGAEPDGCVELARERCDLCLAGNHDLVVTGEIDLADFSSSAAAAAQWTRDNIGAEALEFLRSLQPQAGRPRHRPLPRLPARPGLGVRAVHLAGGRVHGPDEEARRRRRSLARGALVPAQRRGRGRGRPRGRRAGAGSERGRMAAQPRRGRPAARRRPARRVAPARHRGVERRVAARRIPDRASRRAPSRRPACPSVLGQRLYTGQ